MLLLPKYAQHCICALHCGFFQENHSMVSSGLVSKRTRERKGARMALLRTSEPPDWTSCCSGKRRFSRHPLQQGTARYRFLSEKETWTSFLKGYIQWPMGSHTQASIPEKVFASRFTHLAEKDLTVNLYMARGINLGCGGVQFICELSLPVKIFLTCYLPSRVDLTIWIQI